MIPTTFLSGVVFLLLIAPGVLWDLGAKKRKVSSPESSFRETSRVVLYSSVLSLASIILMSCIMYVHPEWFFSVRSFLSDPNLFYKTHPLIIWRSILIEAAIAFSLVLIPNFGLLEKQGWKLNEVSPWQKVLRNELPRKTYLPYARVRLVGGRVYSGLVADYTPDFEMADREIVLGQPIWYESQEKKMLKLPSEWQRMIFAASMIESITVKYLEMVED